MPNTELEKYYLEITKRWYDPILFWLGYKFERLPRYMEVDEYELILMDASTASWIKDLASWIKDLQGSFLRDRWDKKFTEWSNIPRRTFVQEGSLHKPGEVPATEYYPLPPAPTSATIIGSTRKDAVASFLTITCGLLVSGLATLTFFICEPTIEDLLGGMFMFGFTISPFMFLTISELLTNWKPIDAIRGLKLPALGSFLISLFAVICLAGAPDYEPGPGGYGGGDYSYGDPDSYW